MGFGKLNPHIMVRPLMREPREPLLRIGVMASHFVMMMGLLLLIATPVMRVAVSILAFAVQRDWRFVAITSVVLALLLLSFLLGNVE